MNPHTGLKRPPSYSTWGQPESKSSKRDDVSHSGSVSNDTPQDRRPVPNVRGAEEILPSNNAISSPVLPSVSAALLAPPRATLNQGEAANAEYWDAIHHEPGIGSDPFVFGPSSDPFVGNASSSDLTGVHYRTTQESSEHPEPGLKYGPEAGLFNPYAGSSQDGATQENPVKQMGATENEKFQESSEEIPRLLPSPQSGRHGGLSEPSDQLATPACGIPIEYVTRSNMEDPGILSYDSLLRFKQIKCIRTERGSFFNRIVQSDSVEDMARLAEETNDSPDAQLLLKAAARHWKNKPEASLLLVMLFLKTGYGSALLDTDIKKNFLENPPERPLPLELKWLLESLAIPVRVKAKDPGCRERMIDMLTKYYLR